MGDAYPSLLPDPMFRWEIWAVALTTARSSSTWVFLLPILVRAVLTVCTIRRLMISPGSRKFGDPDFLYEQEMARIFGLEALRMADADVLPYDYEEYGKEVAAYADVAAKRAESKFGNRVLDFSGVTLAAKHFQDAGAKILSKQRNPPRDAARLNHALLGAERALLVPEGLPHRPWFRHAIYAPGEYTGYAAVVIPGVNEALDKGDVDRARQQMAVLAAALERAAKALEGYR